MPEYVIKRDATSSEKVSKSRTYVLVHGAWHGGWVWRKVADALRAMGHVVYAPSLTGLGDRRHLLRPGINLDTHCNDIVNLITTEGLGEVVLVGWSYGGFVISDVVARIPEKIASLIYLDAFAPDRGRTVLSYSERASSIDEAIQRAVEGRDVPPLDWSMMGVTDEAFIDYATSRLSPQPVMTYLQASKAAIERPRIPHTYVLATRSPIIAFRPFYEMFKELEYADAYTVDADHLLMMTAVDVTVDILATAQ
jgi:pimeloyl-ACP methyl ester carboxylesterase